MSLPIPEDSHPYCAAVRAALTEFEMGEQAQRLGNEGRVRVCGRRAVGAFIQMIAPLTGRDYGTHAMANLRAIGSDTGLPEEIRTAAERLLGGIRSIVSNEAYSTDPLGDAATIINYFVNTVSRGS